MILFLKYIFIEHFFLHLEKKDFETSCNVCELVVSVLANLQMLLLIETSILE